MQRPMLDDHAVIEETIEQCVLADEMGFAAVWFVCDHKRGDGTRISHPAKYDAMMEPTISTAPLAGDGSTRNSPWQRFVRFACLAFSRLSAAHRASIGLAPSPSVPLSVPLSLLVSVSFPGVSPATGAPSFGRISLTRRSAIATAARIL